MKAYHFCTKEFYKELIMNGIIYANDKIYYRDELHKIGEDYVKEYVFKVKKLNNGNGMFFAWSNPEYKGKIKYNDNGDYILLELNIPDGIGIKTHYENWCSLGMDIYDANGDYTLADKYCREEFGIKDGLEGSYNAIFELEKYAETQILLPYIDSKWIRDISIVEKRYI